ncbi:hypothetical protein EON83_25535 [bacterium]|nr:MAG: hypothetical protein EON83_25535 [bacterium]
MKFRFLSSTRLPVPVVAHFWQQSRRSGAVALRFCLALCAMFLLLLPWFVQAQSAPPSAPSNFVATWVPGQINVSWDAVPGATSYKILRSTVSGNYTSAYTKTVTTTASYTLGQTIGTRYFLVVRAINSIGESVNSTQISVTPVDAPTNLNATWSSGRAILDWDAAAGATGYKIFRNTSGVPFDFTTPVATVNGNTTTAYINTGLTNGTTYGYIVRGTNVDSDSSNSNQKSVKPLAAPVITATWSGTQGNVSWPAVASATSYEVFRRVSGGSFDYNTPLTTTSSTSYTDTPLSTGTTYVYVVRALNVTGETIDSNSVSVSPVSAPSNFAAKWTTSRANFTWTGVSGANNYKVYKRVDGESYDYDTPVATTNSTTSVASALNLINDTKYYFVMRATNTSGSSSNTAELSVTPRAASTLSTNSVSTTQVSLSWTEVPTATSYKLFRRPSGGSFDYNTPLTTTNSTIYSDTGLTGGSTYVYTVRSVNSSGETIDSNLITIVPQLPPTNLSATAGPGQISLSWTSVSGANQYQLLRGTSSTSLSPLTTRTTNSYVDTPVTNGTTYYYAVSVSKATPPTQSDASAPVSAVPIVPSVPSGLTRVAGDSQVALSWNPATAATGYIIQRGLAYIPNSAETFVNVGTTNGNTSVTYTDTTPTNNTSYYYRIVATNPGGNSAPSSFVDATPLDSPVLSATAGNAQVQLSWNNTGAGTKVQRRTGTGAYTVLSPNSGQSYTDTTAANGTTYTYQVVCFNYSGEAASNEVTVTPTLPPTPLAPSNFKAEGKTGQIQLSWDGMTGITKYAIRRATAENGSYSDLNLNVANTSTSYTDSTADNGTLYWYKLTAFNAQGEGVEAKTSSTSLAVPSGLTVNNVTQTGLTLSWNTVTGAAGYKVYLVEGTNKQLKATVNQAPYQYSATNLTANTSYSYEVVAYHITGTSDAATITATTSNTPVVSMSGPNNVGLNVSVPEGNSGTTDVVFTVTLSAPSSQIVTVAYTTVNGSAVQGTDYVQASGTLIFQPNDTSKTITVQVKGDTLVEGNETFHLDLTSFTNACLATGTTLRATITIFDEDVPGTPTNLVATAGNAKVDLTWNSVPGATSYEIERTRQDNLAVETKTSSTNLLNDTGLINGKTYSYTVKAIIAGIPSLESTPISATPLDAPSKPTLTATIGNYKVTLTWTKPGNTTGFQLYRSLNSGQYGQPYKTFGSQDVEFANQQYIDSQVENGTTYFYQIVATGIGGESQASDEVSAKPQGSIDARIKNAPSGSWVGEDRINETAYLQKASRNVEVGETGIYSVSVRRNYGTSGQTVNLKAQGAGTNTKFFVGAQDQDITALITSANGWNTYLDAGQELVVRVEVTVVTGTTVGTTQSVLIKATDDTPLVDAVEASTTAIAPTGQPDASIRLTPEEGGQGTYIGVGDYSQDGSQRVTTQTIPGQSQAFDVQIKNTTNALQKMRVRLPAVPAGWSVTLRDALVNGADITTDAKGATGWLTAQLAVNATKDLRLELIPQASASLNGVVSLSVEKESGGRLDVVQAVSALQKVDYIEYTLNPGTDGSGAGWLPVPTGGITVPQGSIVGFRAIRGNQDVPWPNRPFKPAWTQGEDTFAGDDVWLYFPDVTPANSAGESVQVECGNTVTAIVHVIPEPEDN